jgi:hypothetical protein
VDAKKGSGGGQLDGQRQAVQAAADGAHRFGVLVAEPKLGPGLAGAGDEQLDPVGLAERRHCPGDLAVDPERLPAGSYHLHRRRRSQQRASDLGSGLHQVLAVIQHQQRPLAS